MSISHTTTTAPEIRVLLRLHAWWDPQPSDCHLQVKIGESSLEISRISPDLFLLRAPTPGHASRLLENFLRSTGLSVVAVETQCISDGAVLMQTFEELVMARCLESLLEQQLERHGVSIPSSTSSGRRRLGRWLRRSKCPEQSGPRDSLPSSMTLLQKK